MGAVCWGTAQSAICKEAGRTACWYTTGARTEIHMYAPPVAIWSELGQISLLNKEQKTIKTFLNGKDLP